MRYYGLLFLSFVLSVPAVSQTYYYERIAVVKNGVKTSASGDGHFITFTSKGCYDSDRDGFSEDTGFRQYKSSENNIRSYYGDSYFGNAYYYFNPDCSRLNIKRESDGETYVYVRKSPPAGKAKSSRKKSSEVSVPLAFPLIGVVTIPGSTQTPPPAAPTATQPRRCAGCNGTGFCSMCKGKGWYKNTYDTKVYSCPSCHGSGRCGVCYGKGYFK